MEYSVEELKIEDKKLKKLIDKCAQKNNLIKEKPETYPIYDGICSAEKYFNASKKIMWILKEPYDVFTKNDKPKGGRWSITKKLINDTESMISYKNNWRRRLIYTSYSILEGKKYNEIDDYWENKEVVAACQCTAYINVSKMPAQKKTKNSELWEKFQIWKNILYKQIETYNPEIIIFGGTFGFFREYFFPHSEPSVKTYRNITEAYYSEDRLLLSVNHPSSWINNDEDYINSINEAVSKWEKSRDKTSQENKYKKIKFIANSFHSAELKISGQGLADILNSSGYKTSYGTEYCGTRGTYKLISDAWHFYNDKGDKKTAGEIEYVFIRPNGLYAYE